MLAMWGEILLIAGAYLLGSAPHLAALGKLRGISLEGDMHINLWRKGGRLIGLAGILLELAKGAIPVLAGKALHYDTLIVTLAGLAVVMGQMWPVFSRFNGEKGNSIGAGMAAALAIKPLLIAIIPFAIGAGIKTLPRLFIKRQSLNEWTKFGGPPSISLPLGMGTGFLVLPIASWGFGAPAAVTAGFAVLFILIIIRRVTAGLSVDLKDKTNVSGIILNRILYDRSYR